MVAFLTFIVVGYQEGDDHSNVLDNFARAKVNIGLYLVTVLALYLIALTFLLLNQWRFNIDISTV